MRISNYLGAFALAALPFASGAMAQEGDPAAGEQVAKLCSSCHKFGEGAKNAFGPVLNGVVGRDAGTFEGYKYSNSLKAAGEQGLVWTEENIFEWLGGTSAMLKDRLGDDKAKSKMTFKVADEQKRRDVIAFLKTLSEDATEMEEDTIEMTHGDVPFDTSVMENDRDAGLPEGIERVRQELVKPPMAPEHTIKAEGEPRLIEVVLTVEEKEMVIDGLGTKLQALTFEGSIPAPLIVAHQDDYVEVTVKNPSTNTMEHNIDLHAVTGGLGGAALTTVSPGEEATIRFKADRAGAFLYHCAPEGTMTPYHTTHGMTGAILVLPREGLKDGDGNDLSYDKLYYIGENSFYMPRNEDGSFKQYESTADDYTDWVEEMRGLIPSHVVFNGRVGALTGKDALRANVGETVMFLHMVPNRDTRPHLIGGHGDYVWERGSFSNPPMKNLETWFVAGGSVGAALYKFQLPGIYVYLNHNLIEAVELGAAAHVVVEGEWDDDILRQVYHGPIKE